MLSHNIIALTTILFVLFLSFPVLSATSLFGHNEGIENKVGQYFMFSRNTNNENFEQINNAFGK